MWTFFQIAILSSDDVTLPDGALTVSNIIMPS